MVKGYLLEIERRRDRFEGVIPQYGIFQLVNLRAVGDEGDQNGFFQGGQ